MSSTGKTAARPPAGPLAVTWLGCDLPDPRAGVAARARVTFRNEGTVQWHPPDESERGIWLGSHWLDRLGNAIVWDGERAPLPRNVAPGEEITLATTIRAPIPPGPYRLAFDLVDEGRCWFADVGNEPIERDVDVAPRLLDRTLSVVVSGETGPFLMRTQEALAGQDEPIADGGGVVAFLAAGCTPQADWSRLVLDSHDEGYAAVGGSLKLTGARLVHREARRALAPWTPGSGRKPNWNLPLVCPSLAPEVRDLIPMSAPVGGLPAVDLRSGYGDPWLFDGRIVVSVALRALQRAGRRRDGTQAPRP